MQKYFIATLCLFCSITSVAQFVSNNLVVAQLGDGSIIYNGGAAARCVLKEYSTTGTLVSTTNMPITASGNNRVFMLNNGAFGGTLSLSQDSRYLLIGGYDVAEQSQPVASFTAGIAPRIVGRIDKTKAINTATVTGQYGGDAINAAYSNNGYDIWTAGGNINGAGGVRYMTLNATNSSLISNGDLSNYQISAFGNQLYTSSGTTFNVGAIGTGLPTTTTTTINNLNGLPVGAGRTMVGFFFADVSTTIAGNDVLYILNGDAFGGANELLKYSLVGTNWVLNNTIAITTPRGITGKVTGTSVDLYIVNNTNLLKLTDNTGYNNNMTASITTLASAPNNTFFKGVSFTPENNPLPPPPNPNIINVVNNCVVKSTPSFAKITNWVNGYTIIATKNGNPLTINPVDTSFEYFTPGQAPGTFVINVKFIQSGQPSETTINHVVSSMLTPQLVFTTFNTPTPIPYCTNKNINFTVTTANIGDNPTYTWKDGATVLGTSTTPNFTTQFTTSGQKVITVDVSFTIGSNCLVTNTATSSNNVTFTVVGSPATPIITPSPTASFCTGGSTVLTSNATTGNQWYLNAGAITGATNATYTANAAGSYTIINTASGCSSAVSVATVVTVNPLPAPPTISWNTTQLSTTNGFAAYKWFLNNIEIVGATTNTYTPTASGNYKVEVTDANGCKNSSVDYNLTITSINTVRVDGITIDALPNPAIDLITLKISGQNFSNKLVASLYNNNGKLITTTLLKNSLTTIPVAHLPNGLYTIKISGKKEISSIKIIVAH